MKKLFTLIVVLITLSLLGIILFQLSWLKNMAKLREDQVKQKISDAVGRVGAELTLFKTQYATPLPRDPLGIYPLRPRSYRELFNPNMIGYKLTNLQIHDKIRKALNDENLHEVGFEFMLWAKSSGQFDIAERQSPNYQNAYKDTIHNYIPSSVAIVASSGSAFENLAQDEFLTVVAVNWKKTVIKSLTGRILLVILFTLVIISAFFVTVYTMLRQKKLGEIKNDFINNMTHEFKTPLATISLAVDSMKNEKVMADKERMAYFRNIIKEENQRMNKQVETILKASQFEKKEVELDKKKVHVHEIIKLVVDKFSLQLLERQGKAELILNASDDVIFADEIHFANLVNNLVDNAIKYSKENVPIQLRIYTSNSGRKIVLKFVDNGIGMSKETQKRVFEKFYRAHVGNLHNVKGFGLGLNYVKSVTQSHQGTVKIESAIGKGSTFILEFPLAS